MSSIVRKYDPVPDLDVLRVDVADVVTEGQAALERLLGWLERADPSMPIPGLKWTVHDLVAHLSIDAYTRLARGEESPYDLNRRFEQSAAALARLREVPTKELVARVQANGEEFLAAIAGRPTTEPLGWHSGEPLTVGLLAAVVLNEIVLHGCDVARAVGAKPVIPVRAAQLGCPSVLVTAAYVYKPSSKPIDARVELRVRGVGALVWRFTSDRLRLEPPGGRVDMHVSADPVTFLQVSYGRMSQTRAVLGGGLIAWGRRPTALRLLQQFEPA